MAAARIQRWAILLAAYSYTFKYKPGSEHSNADSLSRLSVPFTNDICYSLKEDYETDVVDILLTEIDRSPVSSKEVRNASRRDAIIGKIIDGILNNRFNELKGTDFQPYLNRKQELSVDTSCLLWENRVVIPPILQDKVFEELHQCHPGSSRMKALSRSYF